MSLTRLLKRCQKWKPKWRPRQTVSLKSFAVRWGHIIRHFVSFEQFLPPTAHALHVVLRCSFMPVLPSESRKKKDSSALWTSTPIYLPLSPESPPLFHRLLISFTAFVGYHSRRKWAPGLCIFIRWRRGQMARKWSKASSPRFSRSNAMALCQPICCPSSRLIRGGLFVWILTRSARLDRNSRGVSWKWVINSRRGKKNIYFCTFFFLRYT